MIRPKKHLGQHFLRDENIAQKIVGYLNPEYPLVLEIGPGMGSLSKYLLQDPRFDPYFMEVDREAVSYLISTFPEISGKLIEADFLKYDLSCFPSPISHLPSPISFIGNFPYNISSQILFKALEYRHRVREVIGMFQKEVALRVASPPGNRTYGILSVLLQAFFEIDYLFTVNENVFDPPPKVKSAVIRLRRNEVISLGCDEALFFRVVKMAFNQRRKTLRNALRPLLDKSLLSDDSALKQMLDLRAERLNVSDFVALTLAIKAISP
ncbi:MAG: 16S rRNA (adenine(1518)-N(6)/adenine(1519)-N(6))-dimethyltransferase RsmA [Bacteroidales bacterium]|nr:16S rRNA (adenine(1518)-N(6)/adenine(1519)-N(6))-dimethyltransferase RsmA [Bacteroidales bacterium]